MAGSQCPPKVMADVVEKLNMKDITICYGMTETSPVSFQSPMRCPEQLKCETVGKVHPHVTVKLIREDQNTAKLGERG